MSKGYIDFKDGKELFWKNETLWKKAAELQVKEVMLDDLPWKEDGCHNLGNPPKWGKVAEHCKHAMEVDSSFPIIIGPQGEIVDGMHRIIKAFVDGKSFY